MLKNKRFLVVALAMIGALLMPAFAGAAQLTQAGIRLGRLGISASSGNDMLVTFKLNTTPTSTTDIVISFPSGFTLTAGTPTPTTGSYPNTPASITAPPGTLTSTVTSSGAGLGGTIDVTGFTSASLNNTTLYGFYIPTGSIANPASAGQYNTSVTSKNGASTLDTTSTPVYIYGVSTNQDQIQVNASVAPTFSFQLSANTDTIPTDDPSSTQTSGGVNMIVGTNSPLGYTAYVKSGNGALNSATSGGTIPTGTFDGTPDTMTNGTSKYTFVPSTGAACSSCNGSITYDGEYNGITGTTGGSFNGTSFASFVSRSGFTNADTINLKERVTVANTVPYANDYTDTLTIVAAGNF